MFGRYFYYNSHTSQEFNLVMGGFNYTEDIPLAMSRNVYRGGFSKVRKTPNFMGTEYNDVLSFTISLIKDPCVYPEHDDMYFTEDEVDEIVSWLTEPNYPTLFHMYDYEPIVNHKYDYYAVVDNITPQVFAGDVVGFTVSFVTNSPYAWSEEITQDITNFTQPTEYSFTVSNSERLGTIFPVITITPTGANTSISIGNVRDGTSMTINNHLSSQIVIDCQRSMFYDANGLLTFEDLGIEDVDSIYWFRLYNGTNTIELTGAARFQITYREPRKVGAY